MIITLDIVITLRFSINCSAVICSPTTICAILREATSETYGPVSGAMLIPANTYGDRALSVRGGGGERAKSGSRQCTRGDFLPSFGPHGCVKPYCCLFVYIGFLLRSDGRCRTECESVLLCSRNAKPFLRCAWASFYTLKGSPTGGNVDKKGKNGKGCGRCSYRYCGYSVPYLTLTAGDKGIKCLSESPKQCKR